jgi:NADPH-dependent glutamate synthase beta subunit-like oxidoreductase
MPPDFSGSKVIVVGGGNVAMDAARTAVRLGAEKVSIVYRRRRNDMTALPSEVEAAVAEGVEMVTLNAPAGIVAGENGAVAAFRAQPQIVGRIGSDGRPAPQNSRQPEVTIPCDIVIMAVGQAVGTDSFEKSGIPVNRGRLSADIGTAVTSMPGVFAGGDCLSGPATVIRAIEAGKVAAANIDRYLGFDHKLEVKIDISFTALREKPLTGRVEMTEREAGERKHDFGLCEKGMTREEVSQEASRCLRCDHFGFGALGRGNTEW